MKSWYLVMIFAIFCATCNAQPASKVKTHSIARKNPISFSNYSTQHDLAKEFGTPGSAGENIIVRGKRRPLINMFSESSELHEFSDGHTEREVELMHGFEIKVRMGKEIDRDPVTGTNLRPFGEAYAHSSPIATR